MADTTSSKTDPSVVANTAGQRRQNLTVRISGLTLPRKPAKVLTDVLVAAGLRTAKITSVTRTPHDQARVMYENLEANGIDANLRLYKEPGQKVIEIYKNLKGHQSSTQIISLMEAKIKQLGPSKVSLHCSTTHYVFDVAPSSIANKASFVAAVEGARKRRTISKFLKPPKDPAYHIEIPK
jgi:hypothetical protein